MPESKFTVASYGTTGLGFGTPNVSHVRVLTMNSAVTDGHGQISYSLEVTASHFGKIVPGKLVHTFDGAAFHYAFRIGVSEVLLDHCHQVCIHERPITIEAGYSGDEILPFTAPSNGPGKTERQMNYFRIHTKDEPTGEGLEDIRKLLGTAEG